MKQLSKEEQTLLQKQHNEDLDYILNNTYTDMRFFLHVITDDSASSYTYFGDMKKNIFFISDNLRDRFGFERNLVEDLLTKWESRIYPESAQREYRSELQKMIAEKRDLHDMRYQVKDVDGKVRWIRCYGKLKWNENKTEPLYFAGRITHQDDRFMVDPVSNLPGEIVMLRHLDMIQKKGKNCLTVGFCLNHITQINSIQGRTYGNRLIREIANQLSEHFAGKMFFYRLDGMRFMSIVNPDCSETPNRLITRLRQMIEENYVRLGMEVNCPCSFAVMKYPQPNLTPIDFQENMTSLIRLARNEQGKPYIDDSDGSILKMQKLSNMEMLLNYCVKAGMEDFRAVIQPVVSAADGHIVGGETLMRWRFDGSDVSPGIFIPLLESSNMICIAGRWIFEQAVKACVEIRKTNPDFYLTVNVSLQQLYDEGLTDFMEEILQRYSLDGQYIVVEMTESCMDKEPDKLNYFVKACEKMHIRIALDDFGTGYSSLRVLLRYPSRIIKIDRSLLLEMSESEDKLSFISSIVYACHKFGKKVCIEGVETEIQRKLALEAGCDVIQGFYFYHPTELPSLYEYLHGVAKHNN